MKKTDIKNYKQCKKTNCTNHTLCRATLPLTTDTKELSDCMCPHLSNLNHNNGSELNASNIVTDLSNISNQGYDVTELRRFDRTTPVTSNNTNNGDVINSTIINSSGIMAATTTTTQPTPVTSITTATNTSPTDESRLRHSSMDRLMSLFNDLGNSTRTRSLSDGGQEEGKNFKFANSCNLINSFVRLFFFLQKRKKKFSRIF